MKVTIAYIEEPPFGWCAENGTASGADIELAQVLLRACGIDEIAYRLTTFDELLPGAARGDWEMNVPLFVTPERAKHVTFSTPVWAIGDGFLVHRGNPKALVSYEAVAARDDARLGIIAGQVQFDAATAAGAREPQIVLFKTQPEALDALRTGEIDAYASTAVGNRVLANHAANATLEAVAHARDHANPAPVGAFSFNPRHTALIAAVNAQLAAYLGSADHRERMAKYGLTHAEIDGALHRAH